MSRQIATSCLCVCVKEDSSLYASSDYCSVLLFSVAIYAVGNQLETDEKWQILPHSIVHVQILFIPWFCSFDASIAEIRLYFRHLKILRLEFDRSQINTASYRCEILYYRITWACITAVTENKDGTKLLGTKCFRWNLHTHIRIHPTHICCSLFRDKKRVLRITLNIYFSSPIHIQLGLWKSNSNLHASQK